VADQLGLQRDLYYGLYAAAVVALFVAWARDTRQPLRAGALGHADPPHRRPIEPAIER
jgi:hypothetical protein